MMRRSVLAALTSGLFARKVLAAAAERGWQPVQMLGRAAQIAAGGPTGLLAVSAEGMLLALSTQGAPARRLADGIDPQTPIATGHGRIAARRADGALWVLDQGRVGASAEQRLARHAGILVLPLAVIVVESDGGRHRAARYEPAQEGAWRSVARSQIDLLPDARPLQADLDGSGDGGHVVLLAGPDGERYRHGVLGDAIEATRIVLLERHSLDLMRELTLPPPHVFEDIAPRRVTLAGRDGLLTVRAGPQGGQLVLVDADPARPRALRIAAQGEPLGTANRWMSPIVAGSHWLAVHTPHIGGVLHAYRREGDRLVARRLMDGVSNHRIGSRTLDQSAQAGGQLWLPTQSGREVRIVDPSGGSGVPAERDTAGRVSALVALQPSSSVAAMLDDGSVVVAA
jgi:hypothetical protein